MSANTQDHLDIERLLDEAARRYGTRHSGWDTLMERLPAQEPGPDECARTERRWTSSTPRSRFLWWSTATVATSLSVVVLLVVCLPRRSRDVAQPEPPPIEVKRCGIEVTILSELHSDEQTAVGDAAVKPEAMPEEAMTPYRWTAARHQAKVKDRRMILHLQRGDNIVKFTDVAASIDPATVRLVSDTDPAGTKVIEQSLESDLARPTLVWKLRTDKAGDHSTSLTYLCSNISWQANYVATITDGGGKTDTLDLSGWVTINNASGTTYNNANVKLLAGDAHVAEYRPGGMQGGMGGMSGGAAPPAGMSRPTDTVDRFEGSGFSNYHQYALGRRATLSDAQPEQIELLKVEKIPVVKRYVYRPEMPDPIWALEEKEVLDFGGRVLMLAEFKNSQQASEGLGVALPQGVFRVYRRDDDSPGEFIGQDEVDHTSKEEPVRIRIGYAEGLAGRCTRAAVRQNEGEKWREEDWKITISNDRDELATVVVEQPLVVRAPKSGRRNWQILKHSDDFRRKDAATLEFWVEVPANDPKTITFTVRYRW